VTSFLCFLIENNLSYLVGSNISMGISATTGDNITSVAINATAGGNSYHYYGSC